MSLSSLLGASIMLNGLAEGLKVFAIIVVLGFVIKGLCQGFKKALAKN
ncbi:hypothetical protein COB47_2268 [Caldicellulosiruptor obsidiansis OB47]|uniref:Uncharacterized protein n=1 Tax=Caldicellulosiruptor obsidiansis (strain ATCC BAA-2073 / JCM 16842 / OB47) TaxID=608506 RepID=D9THN3_CALOO|nr:hypothetical protein [Caldicellulosiruptor obsidiansis]ADL43508.1 hypothetical protein COB47_2268 [Caldicellulosiruptor obsidiansis OB47]